MIVYNVPQGRGSTTPETFDAIAGLPGVVAVKKLPNLIQVADMMRLVKIGFFYSGSDEVIVPLMSLGGQGVISVASNVARNLPCPYAKPCKTTSQLRSCS